MNQKILNKKGYETLLGSGFSPNQFLEDFGTDGRDPRREIQRYTGWSNMQLSRYMWNPERDQIGSRVRDAAATVLRPWIEVGDPTGFTYFTVEELSNQSGESVAKVESAVVNYGSEMTIVIGPSEYCLQLQEVGDDKLPTKKLIRESQYYSTNVGSKVSRKSRPVPGMFRRKKEIASREKNRVCLVKKETVQEKAIKKTRPRGEKLEVLACTLSDLYPIFVGAREADIQTLRKMAFDNVAEVVDSFPEKRPDLADGRTLALARDVYLNVSRIADDFDLDESTIYSAMGFIFEVLLYVGDVVNPVELYRGVIEALAKDRPFRVVTLDCLRWLYKDEGFEVIPDLKDRRIVQGGKTIFYDGKSDELELVYQLRIFQIAEKYSIPCSLTLLYADSDVEFIEKEGNKYVEEIAGYVGEVRSIIGRLDLEADAFSVLGFFRSRGEKKKIQADVDQLATTLFDLISSGNFDALDGYRISEEFVKEQVARTRDLLESRPGYDNSFLDRYESGDPLLYRVCLQLASEIILMTTLTGDSDLLVIPTKSGKLWERTISALALSGSAPVAANLYLRSRREIK